MARYGAQFGPDITFLGVPACHLDDASTYADADVVVVGAPFDGGTSHRPGTRFGPQAIRMTDYLPHDGITVLLAEQNAGSALSIADRALVLQLGRVVVDAAASELDRERLQHAYLGG